MEEKLEELLGRKLLPKEREYADWMLGWDRETIDVFEQLFYEVHATGLIRGLTGRNGGKMLDERGWMPMESLFSQGGDCLDKGP